MLNAIASFLSENQHFAICSHSRPDGDSLGSALGLGLALRSLGKRIEIVNADPAPSNYAWLPAIETVKIVDRLQGEYDAVAILECNDFARAGVAGLQRYFSINIDHHPASEEFADLNWIDPSASAVGEMIFELISRMGAELSPEVATNLYVAISTDTGSFQFSNTRARTFEVARRLVEAGADPGHIARSLYMNYPVSRVRLLAELLVTLEVHPSGKISWIHMDSGMLRRTGAESRDTEGLVNYALSIKGVQLCAFFRQEEDRYRVSLRSKGELDVAAVASGFGGGGHQNAAGLEAAGDFEKVRAEVLRALEALLP